MTEATFDRAKRMIRADLKKHGVKNKKLEEELVASILLIGQDAYNEGIETGKVHAIACITEGMERLVRRTL